MSPARERKPLTPAELAMKATFSRLVEEVGGNGAAAIIADVSPSLITAYSRKANDGEAERFAPLLVVHRLEKHCGKAIVSRWMQAEAEVESAAPIEPLDATDIVRIAKESAEAKLAILKLIERRTPAAQAEVRKELDDLIEILTEARRAVDHA